MKKRRSFGWIVTNLILTAATSFAFNAQDFSNSGVSDILGGPTSIPSALSYGAGVVASGNKKLVSQKVRNELHSHHQDAVVQALEAYQNISPPAKPESALAQDTAAEVVTPSPAGESRPAS
ncbi:MAG: hypothetical protein GWM98_01970 [Nitrospinaceae bacterium]|nr:hypothetical protein [Nitrospinaceae bacterium]NIR53500.1 hypothetical protein [Nitrospinaceae bacterium]NIS83899.1 hypothetical protein [Nitrospinaceae bacterium]NIT80701.1 hypothetical protein [Nitrospinaceae bacterium]NIU43016.1 hypothetical protein [Nitrospinaceae bacterium]